MPGPLQNFLQLMDKHNFVRILVCLLPGIIFSKLSTQLGGLPVLSVLGSVWIFAGVLVWLGWSRIRRFAEDGQPAAANDEAFANDPHALVHPSFDHHEMIRFLVSEVQRDDTITLREALNRAVKAQRRE